MPPSVDWGKLMSVDPDGLPGQEEEADNLVDSLSKVECRGLNDESTEHLVQLFRIAQSLMKMKAQEAELALEEVEKAGEEQAKIESQLKNKMLKLENELEMAQLATGGRDTRFLRDEIRQLEKQLEQKDRELAEIEKELDKEKKVNEQLALRNEEADNESSKLRRENEQLRQDVIDYQRQIDSQRETLMSRRGGDADYRAQLSKKNLELVQYLDEIQNLTEANEKLEIQNQEMTKNLEESVQEMEKMTDEYNRMKHVVQKSDSDVDQLRKEKEQYRLQVHELMEQIRAKNEEDDPVMAAVTTKVEEWKRILASKDDDIIEYQQMLRDLREKLKTAQLDADKGNVMALQQGVQERDNQIKMLTEQMEQYTREIEKNVVLVEDLQIQLQKDKGASSLTHQNRLGELQAMLQLLEQRAKEAERVAELAEGDAREKDKQLVDALKRMRDYEMGVYGLEEAVSEIKELKNHVKTRDREIENLTKEINHLELKINDFLDENEDLRERLGLDPKTILDLTEFKSNKALKQQQYRAENQILLKEIERLEEERVELKQHIRKLAQDKGKRAASLGLTADDLHLLNDTTDELKTRKRTLDFMHPENVETVKEKVQSQFKTESPGRREELFIAGSNCDKAEKEMPLNMLSRKISEIIDQCLKESQKEEDISFEFESMHLAMTQVRDSGPGLEMLSIQDPRKSGKLPSDGTLLTSLCMDSSQDLRSLADNTGLSSSGQTKETSFTIKQRHTKRSQTNANSWQLSELAENSNRQSSKVSGQSLPLRTKSAMLSQIVLGKPIMSQKSKLMSLETKKTLSARSNFKKIWIDDAGKKLVYFQNQNSQQGFQCTLGASHSQGSSASSSVDYLEPESDEDSLISTSTIQDSLISTSTIQDSILSHVAGNETSSSGPLQAKAPESGTENNYCLVEPSTTEDHQSHLDPVENLIEQLRTELTALRSEKEQLSKDFLNKKAQNKNTELELKRLRQQSVQNEYISKELNEKERELERNRTVIAELKSKVKEFKEENKQLEQGMKEILQAIKETQKEPVIKGAETSLMIPSLERLVNAIESKNAEGIFDASVHLKAHVDQLTGRNEELRQELKGSRKEANHFSNQLAKANDKIAHLHNEVTLLRQSEGANIIFRAINLPEGMTVSSTSMINSLNEYLIHLVQELENKEQSVKKSEEALEEYKRKFAVIRHQQGLLYKEYQSERESWEIESEKLKEEKKKLEDQKEQGDVKINEYERLMDSVQLEPDEIKKQLVEISRKLTVLRVNEKSLTRRFTTLVEMEQHLRKENSKLKTDLTEMEVAVEERIGYLQRYKEMAAFKIAALQKTLDDSVQLSELELANKHYNDLTAKYRDMLQKDNLLVQKTTNLEHLESENESLKEQMKSSNKELEITRENLHTLEQAWEYMSKVGGDVAMDKATKAVTNSEIVSISKKITMLEMKELNERQRAEHSQKMYDHLRTTVKQLEERNFELETKFAELTKINLDAQKVERTLRDDLANSVTKAVSDADRRRIMELEKSEAELKIESSKLRTLSDIAKMQVATLMSRQQSREKEVESLRKQVLDYQSQSDEKALIAKLHQHIVALQVSEATAVGKLEAAVAKLQKLEACNLRLEQKLDGKEQALYFARLEGRNRAKHLRQTVQSLRRQFSGALPLAQQEKFSKTMIDLQNDKLKILQEMQRAQQERREAEDRALEMELKLKGLEELLSTLKDTRGAQKVTEWQKRMEELRLHDLKLNRELVKKKEEIKYLTNIISEHELLISGLEEEIVQQSKFHEERQMAWDQREVELERQLDLYEYQQNEVLTTARKFEEATGSVPDSTLPLPQQLDLALQKIKEHIRTILETRAACKTLEDKLKEKGDALWKAEQNVLSRDKVINELRLRLPATAEREKILMQFGPKEHDQEHQQNGKVAHQTIVNMQARLNQKEEVLKKYQHLLAKAREEQEEIAKKHEEDLQVLHRKLDLYSDSSLNKFKQTALELMKKPSLLAPTSKHLMRLVEMEQTVAEQDNSLASLTGKLKKTTLELERQKQVTIAKMKEFEDHKAKLEENHAVEVKKLKNETDELRSLLSQMEKEVQYLNAELESQKEANTRAPTATMKNLVERLKNQLALKEKQQKALSKALLALRAEMTAHAEQQIIASASQKEENLNVQQIVDRQTKDLKAEIENLNEQVTKLKDALKTSKTRESSLTEETESLNQELRGRRKALNRLQKEKDDVDIDNEELKKRVKRLTNSIQAKADGDNKLNLVDELHKKVKRLETELEKKTEDVEKKSTREDKSSKDEIIRWEEGKKWQTKVEGIRSKLKEKEKEVESLTKQFSTLKELYIKADQEKNALQKKLKTRGVTADHVVGVRTVESEKEVEELRKRNFDLENEISHVKTKQAIPRDSVVEDLHLKNRYLQEKLQALERQLSKDTISRPSTSGIGSDDQSIREQELQRENLRLSSEIVELHFQLEQASNDLPRLKNQIADLKDMCEFLKKDKLEVERKLGSVRGSGRSGKTVPELEKTIGLMKKVVEKVQRENDELKKAPGVVSNEKLLNLEQENAKLKSEIEKLKLHVGGQLSTRYESKTKGMEKIITENERLRKELKKEAEVAEKLRIAKNSLEIMNEKLIAQLEETGQRLNYAESRGPQLEGADSKTWKSVVVTRKYEAKMKDMETDLIKKNESIADLKLLLRKSTEREKKLEYSMQDLKEQVDLLEHFPEDAKTEQGLPREFQLLRLTNNRLEKEKAELVHQMEMYRQQLGVTDDESSRPGYDELIEKGRRHDKLMTELVDLQTQMKTSNLERDHLKEEIKTLKKELEHFDPSFFEEIEDLKYNYNEEVKKNIILEEKLKRLSEQFGIHIDIPANVSMD